MQASSINFNFKGRYFKLGEINAQTKAVWFVLHGYGQLAQYFLPKFKSLTEHGICVIAPEGLSHYYLEDASTRSKTGSTRVGASWMTRENRLTDIENYLTYLNSVFKQETANQENLDITLLGFSQGAATASRWALSHSIYFRRLILWAGILPSDMDFEKGKRLLKQKEVAVVYGKNDPFLNESRFAELKTLTEKLEITPRPIVFDGAHEIHEPTLLALI
ncbi:MAG TPA: alpha/beta hydrolase [Cyclobacteriaceae bacterium]|nr:alpha/beta hydrolase [Cyclobacteriaceae bacterium]